MKKILSMMLIVAMTIAMIPYSAIAASGNTVIEVTNIPGYQADVNHNCMTITPRIRVVSGEEPAGYRYQWYAGDQGNGILPWETGASLTIHSQIPAGWLWFEATPLDSNGNAIGNSVKVRYISTYPMKGINDYPALTREQSEQYRNTPKEYLFEVEGVKLILLDILHNGQFYVMMENGVGKSAFDTRGKGGMGYNPTEPENVAYWLNNGFLSEDHLPDTIKNYITEENWTLEGDSPQWSNSNKTYKIGLLSYSEYVAYLGRFGLWLSGYDSWPYSWEGFWLRTLRDGYRPFASAKNGGVDNESGIMGKLYYFDANNAGLCHLRPTFRLSKDFFTENRIDLLKAGSKVKEAIALSGLTALEDIYTKDELIESGVFKKPEVRSFDFKGTFLAGDTVECDYAWYSENRAQEAGSVYGFSVSNAKNGPYTNVAENEKTYTISSNDVGKYLTFYVTPGDSNGVSGELYRSKPILISESAKVIVTDCDIEGQNINITLENLTQNDPATVIVMAAVYDAENNLTDSYAVQAPVPAGETITLDNLSISSAQGSVVKVMVWDSFESMNCIYLSDI